MKRIALAGGIGAGKSTVVDHLRVRGFAAIDADEVYHALVAPEQPLLAVLVDAFGTAVLNAHGGLDRAFLASVVFHDETALRRLNAITHPAVGGALLAQLDSSTGDVAFVAIPLLRPTHRVDLALDEVWSVQVHPDTAVQRLVFERAMSESDARARIAHQMGNDERETLANEIIWNDSDRDALALRVDELLRERGLLGH